MIEFDPSPFGLYLSPIAGDLAVRPEDCAAHGLDNEDGLMIAELAIVNLAGHDCVVCSIARSATEVIVCLRAGQRSLYFLRPTNRSIDTFNFLEGFPGDSSYVQICTDTPAQVVQLGAAEFVARKQKLGGRRESLTSYR